MTKSTITREQLEEWVAQFDEDGGCDATDRQLEALIRQSLAAMDSEPVAFIFKHPAGRLFWSLTDESNKGHDDVMPAYAAPQPAMVAPVCTCPSGDGSLRWPCPVHPGNSPAQSDCFPEQNHASPEQNGHTPAQSQGWIQVSEQMPPSRHEVLVGRWWGERPRWCCKWATYIPGHPDAQSSGWLIPGGSWTPTHWMELPAAPQEVKGE